MRSRLGQELQQQIWSHTRASAQQALEVGSLQDLWLPNPAGWLSAVANLLNNALAASTWKCYAGNLRQFKVYCLVNNISFPPEQDEAIGVIASFLESAKRSSQQPSSTIACLSTAIGALYKTTDFHPTHDPLLSQVKRALVHLCTTRPIKHDAVFDTCATSSSFSSGVHHSPSNSYAPSSLPCCACLEHCA